MKSRCLFALAVFVWPVLMAAQNFVPGKSAAFAQIAAGGGYTSVINLTNRGTTTYSGTISLFQGSNQSWSPVINGTPVSNGSAPVTIAPGATVTLTITLPGGVAVGFATITTTDNSLTNSVEGTLTYYIRSGTGAGTGAAMDSVGIPPAKEIYLTTIPFDDFNTVAVALVNLNPFGVTAKMTVFSGTGQVVSTLNQPLSNMQHLPQYLSQFFPGVSLTRGRLEIQCDSLIIGEALTQVQGGQFSSLPFSPAIKTYTGYSTAGGGHSSTGELYLWIDGSSVTIYARVLTEGGSPVQGDQGFFTGQISNNGLTFYEMGQNSSGDTYIQYWTCDSFSISAPTVACPWTSIFLNPVSPGATGTMTLTATN
jgi:hypothetical protein